MKIVNQKEVKKSTVEGTIGHIDIIDAIAEDGVHAGVRVIHPHSTVPKAPHKHEAKQINYVIKGRCEYQMPDGTRRKLNEGDFIILDANEEHYYVAFDEPVLLFEVKWPERAKEKK